MSITADDPWLLRVLGAFQSAMNTGKPADVPPCAITWPDATLTEGPYTPFVWFEQDNPQFDDGRELHVDTVVVTGVMLRKDPSAGTSVLTQAIRAYYAMRRQVGLQNEDPNSVFNAFFEGVAEPAGGIRPADTERNREVYGDAVIVERWSVTGSSATIGAAKA